MKKTITGTDTHGGQCVEMVKKIYVFGVTPFAEMLRYYIEDMDNEEFISYVVDEKYMPDNAKLGNADVISWDSFVRNISPKSCEILSSVAYGSMNSARETTYYRIKKAGYKLASFIHPTATVASNSVIGEGNIILENVTIQPFVEIGDNNIFWSNVNICHHTTIGSFNFFAASSAVLGKVNIGNKCFIGCNSTLKNGVTIESSSLIGASAYVADDCDENSVIVPTKSVLLDKKTFDMKI